MKLPRLIPLRVWLATILLMAAAMLAPGAASAHPGHGGDRVLHQAADFHASADAAPLAIHDGLANVLLLGDDAPAAILAAQPDGEPGCAGAGCCGTGHGCCVAYLPGGDDAAPPPATGQAAFVLAGAPPGLGAPILPEPPRPFR